MPWSAVAWYKSHITFCFWKIQSQAHPGNTVGENEVDAPETNHTKKASQADHGGGAHEDDEEEVRTCEQKELFRQ